MVALSARTGGSRHTGLAALPHENNHLCKVKGSLTSFTLIRDIAYLCKQEDVKKIPFKYLFFDN